MSQAEDAPQIRAKATQKSGQETSRGHRLRTKSDPEREGWAGGKPRTQAEDTSQMRDRAAIRALAEDTAEAHPKVEPERRRKVNRVQAEDGGRGHTPNCSQRDPEQQAEDTSQMRARPTHNSKQGAS